MKEELNKERTYEVNKKILIAEMLEFERQFFEEKASYCSCGAKSFGTCNCNTDEKAKFRRQLKRKRKEKFRGRSIGLLKLKLPTLS